MNPMKYVKYGSHKMFFAFIAITALMFAMVGAGCSSDEEDPITGNDPQTPIMSNINYFYGLCYSGLSSFESQDCETVLDVESKFGSNFVVYLDGLIAESKYAVDKGYIDLESVLDGAVIPDMKFQEIKVEGDKAEVILSFEYGDDLAAPLFVSPGENRVSLIYKNYMWLIDSIQAEDNKLLELLNESTFTAEDPEEMQARVDAEYGVN